MGNNKQNQREREMNDGRIPADQDRDQSTGSHEQQRAQSEAGANPDEQRAPSHEEQRASEDPNDPNPASREPAGSLRTVVPAQVGDGGEPKAAPVTPTKPASTGPIVISGRAGGVFNIDGDGFGDTKGSVTVGDASAEITSWNDRRIKGTLPVGASGNVIVSTSTGKRTTTFPPVSADKVAKQPGQA